MTLAELQKKMIEAMKAKDKTRKDAISNLVAAVKRLAIDSGCRDDIPEDMVEQAIMKELKSLREQVDTCPADRTDLLEEYKAKLAIVEEFAPKMMSAEEVEAFLKENCAEAIASKNKGMIMKTAMAMLKGKAEGKTVGEVAAKLIG